MTALENRCSVQSRALDADPIATAGTYDAYALIEVPLPWPREITDHPLLHEAVGLVATMDRRVRVLGLVPDATDRATAEVRVIVYRRPSGPFVRYHRDERSVVANRLADTVASMLESDNLRPDQDDGVTDVLMCTHGRRDRCCGSFGMNLFTAVGVRHMRSNVRTWRVSHTGGHRFAPTAIFLPEGHLWAWLDADLVNDILHRTRPPAELIGHYRGSSAIESAVAQVAERAAFTREGWRWLDSARSATVVEQDATRTLVRLDAQRPDGSSVSYAAVVTRTGTILQPTCGEPAEDRGRADPVWDLTAFEQVDTLS